MDIGFREIVLMVAMFFLVIGFQAAAIPLIIKIVRDEERKVEEKERQQKNQENQR